MTAMHDGGEPIAASEGGGRSATASPQYGATVSGLEGEEAETFVTFDLGGQGFGLSVCHVREILNALPVTDLPDAPHLIEGLIDIRGSTIPVYDLAGRLGLARPNGSAEERMVVIEFSDGQDRCLAGIRAERVKNVCQIHPSEIEPAPEFTGDLGRAGWMQGVVRIDGGLVLLMTDNGLFDGSILPASQLQARGAEQ